MKLSPRDPLTKAQPLGRDEDYFLGNGIVGAAVSAFGAVTLSIGPDYTSPNFITSEKLGIEIGGICHEVAPHMSRVRHGGVFIGELDVAGMGLELTDFTLPEQSFFLRRLRIQNNGNESLSVRVHADIESGQTITSDVDSLKITAPVGAWCFGNQETQNWKVRICEVFFAFSCVVSSGQLWSESVMLGPGESHDFLLCHYHYAEGGRAEGAIESIRVAEAAKLLSAALAYWQQWLAGGSFVSDGSRIQDAIEGCLFAVKMQQNRDGGMIAGIHKYANSYVRDCHGAFRLLCAAGYFAECRAIIQNIDAKYRVAGFVPNWWSMGSDSFIGHSYNNDAAEITAYYLLMLRDYMAATGDDSLFDSVHDSARHAADAQLGFMLEHGYLMDFNGDETEQYVCKVDGEEYGGFPSVTGWDHRNFSFFSTCAALTSLEFVACHLQKTGRTEPYSRHFAAIRRAIDETFFDRLTRTHCWAVKRGSLEQLPNVLTNYLLMPLWIGASLNDEAERTNALAVLPYINPDSGFLPNAYPDVPGFCGHSPGLLLYCLLELGMASEAEAVVATILHSPLLSRWGTVSEFYGPGCVPNGHGYRCFESGVVGEALLLFELTLRGGKE